MDVWAWMAPLPQMQELTTPAMLALPPEEAESYFLRASTSFELETREGAADGLRRYARLGAQICAYLSQPHLWANAVAEFRLHHASTADYGPLESIAASTVGTGARFKWSAVFRSLPLDELPAFASTACPVLVSFGTLGHNIGFAPDRRLMGAVLKDARQRLRALMGVLARVEEALPAEVARLAPVRPGLSLAQSALLDLFLKAPAGAAREVLPLLPPRSVHWFDQPVCGDWSPRRLLDELSRRDMLAPWDEEGVSDAERLQLVVSVFEHPRLLAHLLWLGMPVDRPSLDRRFDVADSLVEAVMAEIASQARFSPQSTSALQLPVVPAALPLVVWFSDLPLRSMAEACFGASTKLPARPTPVMAKLLEGILSDTWSSESDTQSGRSFARQDRARLLRSFKPLVDEMHALLVWSWWLRRTFRPFVWGETAAPALASSPLRRLPDLPRRTVFEFVLGEHVVVRADAWRRMRRGRRGEEGAEAEASATACASARGK